MRAISLAVAASLASVVMMATAKKDEVWTQFYPLLDK